MLVIIVTTVVANLGLIPAKSTPEQPVPIYNTIFKYITAITIF